MSTERLPSLAGVPLKHLALVTLTFQNSCLILVMHYSRIMPLVDGRRYYTSTAVLLNEVAKLSISLVVAAYEILARDPSSQQSTSSPGLLRELWRSVFSADSWKLAIPAMLYTLQNSLQYVAVSNLDAATYQVLSQLKILTTALFSVTLLGRSLSVRKWMALVVLMAGVGIVQIPPETLQKVKVTRDIAPALLYARNALKTVMLLDDTPTNSHTLVSRAEETELNGTVGLIAVAIGCMLSGLAGVYFEKVLKDPKSSSSTPSLWIRNIQLSFYSLFPALFIGVLFKDGAKIAETGFFYGYNFMTWMAILSQSTGGILVALVVKYADNIAKNFATSFSIIVSFLASVYFFRFRITYFYLIGTALVIGATYLFNVVPSTTPSRKPVDDEERLETKETDGYNVELDHVASSNEPLLANIEPSEKPEVSSPRRRSSDGMTKRES